MTPLTPMSYFVWSNDIEISVRGKGLCNFVGKNNATCSLVGTELTTAKESSAHVEPMEGMKETDVQRRDLVLVLQLH